MKRILVTLLVLALSLTAFANPQRTGPGAGPGNGSGPGAQHGPDGIAGDILPPPLLAEFLALTAAQIEQSIAIREELRATAEPIRDQLEALRPQIAAAVEAGDVTLTGTLVLQAHALREQLRTAREAADAEFEALLTAGQKAKWDVYKEIVQLRRGRGPQD